MRGREAQLGNARWETKNEREKEGVQVSEAARHISGMRDERGEKESEHVRKGGKPQEALFDREAE